MSSILIIVRNYHGVLLDLIIISLPNIAMAKATNQLLQEDIHDPILDFEVVIKFLQNNNLVSPQYNYARCNMGSVFEKLQNIESPKGLTSSNGDTKFTSFCSILSSIIKTFSPKVPMSKPIFPI